uniref:Uncharacterized protein n=1 Tax=viral metagenome TaxID=1070528 RepID=A0A6C0EDC8_9ZZZZ
MVLELNIKIYNYQYNPHLYNVTKISGYKEISNLFEFYEYLIKNIFNVRVSTDIMEKIKELAYNQNSKLINSNKLETLINELVKHDIIIKNIQDTIKGDYKNNLNKKLSRLQFLIFFSKTVNNPGKIIDNIIFLLKNKISFVNNLLAPNVRDIPNDKYDDDNFNDDDDDDDLLLKLIQTLEKILFSKSIKKSDQIIIDKSMIKKILFNKQNLEPQNFQNVVNNLEKILNDKNINNNKFVIYPLIGGTSGTSIPLFDTIRPKTDKKNYAFAKENYALALFFVLYKNYKDIFNQINNKKIKHIIEYIFKIEQLLGLHNIIASGLKDHEDDQEKDNDKENDDGSDRNDDSDGDDNGDDDGNDDGNDDTGYVIPTPTATSTAKGKGKGPLMPISITTGKGTGKGTEQPTPTINIQALKKNADLLTKFSNITPQNFGISIDGVFPQRQQQRGGGELDINPSSFTEEEKNLCIIFFNNDKLDTEEKKLQFLKNFITENIKKFEQESLNKKTKSGLKFDFNYDANTIIENMEMLNSALNNIIILIVKIILYCFINNKSNIISKFLYFHLFSLDHLYPNYITHYNKINNNQISFDTNDKDYIIYNAFTDIIDNFSSYNNLIKKDYQFLIETKKALFPSVVKLIQPDKIKVFVRPNNTKTISLLLFNLLKKEEKNDKDFCDMIIDPYIPVLNIINDKNDITTTISLKAEAKGLNILPELLKPDNEQNTVFFERFALFVNTKLLLLYYFANLINLNDVIKLINLRGKSISITDNRQLAAKINNYSSVLINITFSNDKNKAIECKNNILNEWKKKKTKTQNYIDWLNLDFKNLTVLNSLIPQILNLINRIIYSEVKIEEIQLMLYKMFNIFDDDILKYLSIPVEKKFITLNNLLQNIDIDKPIHINLYFQQLIISIEKGNQSIKYNLISVYNLSRFIICFDILIRYYLKYFNNPINILNINDTDRNSYFQLVNNLDLPHINELNKKKTPLIKKSEIQINPINGKANLDNIYIIDILLSLAYLKSTIIKPNLNKIIFSNNLLIIEYRKNEKELLNNSVTFIDSELLKKKFEFKFTDNEKKLSSLNKSADPDTINIAVDNVFKDNSEKIKDLSPRNSYYNIKELQDIHSVYKTLKENNNQIWTDNTNDLFRESRDINILLKSLKTSEDAFIETFKKSKEALVQDIEKVELFRKTYYLNKYIKYKNKYYLLKK